MKARKIRAKNQLIDTLSTKNELLVDLVHDLPLHSDVLVLRKYNLGRIAKWIGLFQFIGIEGEICNIFLSSDLTEF